MGNLPFIFRVVKLAGNKVDSVEKFAHLNTSHKKCKKNSCSYKHDYCDWSPDNRTNTIEQIFHDEFFSIYNARKRINFYTNLTVNEIMRYNSADIPVTDPYVYDWCLKYEKQVSIIYKIYEKENTNETTI